MSALPLWRRVFASIASLAGVWGFFELIHGSEQAIAFLPTICLVAAAVLVHVPRLGPQLLARAAWWSNFALGFFIAATGANRTEGRGAIIMTTALGLALFLVGQKGLNEAGERTGFAPTVFRTTFMLLMVLVLADAQTLGLFAVAFSRVRLAADFYITAFGAAALVGAFVGLYRLTLWGVLASLVTSTVVAALFLLELGNKRELATFVTLLCGLQILVAAPMLVCIVTKRSLPRAPPIVGIWFSRVAIVGMWLYAVNRSFIYY